MSLLQVGIHPDTQEARDLVSRCLGWRFETMEDEGVWLVEVQVDWPEDASVDLTITDPSIGTGADSRSEIRVTVEWP